MCLTTSLLNPQGKDPPLIAATNTGNKEIVQLLIDYGAKLDITNIVWELLHYLTSSYIDYIQLMFDCCAPRMETQHFMWQPITAK